MKKIPVLIFFLLMAGKPASGQEKSGLSGIISSEEWLSQAFKKLYLEGDFYLKDSLNQKIINVFTNILKNGDSFLYPWNRLTQIGKIRSQDKKLNIFTWYLKKEKGDFEYYGIIQINGQKKTGDEMKVILLNDRSSGMKNPEMLDLSTNNWYGALYYAIRTYQFRKNTWYALMGFDFNNNFSNKKLIEVMTLDHKGEPVFGGEFRKEMQKVKRVIFEYSSEAVMSMNWDQRLKMIVLDHLSPSDPVLVNNYRFYTPDGSFDAFRFQRGVFILEKDVDARIH